MARPRKLRNINDDIDALRAKMAQAELEKLAQHGRLVEMAGAGALDPPALLGALLEVVERAKKPNQVAVWRSASETFLAPKQRKATEPTTDQQPGSAAA